MRNETERDRHIEKFFRRTMSTKGIINCVGGRSNGKERERRAKRKIKTRKVGSVVSLSGLRIPTRNGMRFD